MATYKQWENPDGTYTRKRVSGPFLRACMWLLLAALIVAGIVNGSPGVRIASIVFAVIVGYGIWHRVRVNR